MRKDFGAKTWMFPMPVLMVATYDENGKADVMNAAWGGIHDTNQIGICLDKKHKTTQNILLKNEFTVSMATEDFVTACDYVGIVSANDEPDKLEKAGFTVSKAPNVDAPIINELPMTLECRVVKYVPESDFFVADIVNVSADESVLTEGKIDPEKLKPIVFDTVNIKYRGLGKVCGNAFTDGQKLK